MGDLLDFPAYGSHDDGHDGAEKVEEAIGQVGECGDSEHRALGHSAGVPRNEDGGDGGGILAGAAQES